jgi:tetratricopeptide (TPR) repeat protein
MMAADSNNNPAARLGRLLLLLASDPANLSLLSEAAEEALKSQNPDTALRLLGQHAEISPLGDKETNIAGLAALQAGNYEEAADSFARLLDKHPAEPSLRFNQAWSLAMLKRFEEALALLDEATARALGQAAMLKVQLMHELGQIDDAAVLARDYVQLFPEHAGLMAAVSVLAIDVEDLALAQECASKAGDLPDALTTLGTLALNDARDSDAAVMFERALAKNARSPRAWVGKGLVELTQGHPGHAAQHIERGAELFDTHIGSWIAAGWAHLLNKNAAAARAAFERALALDNNFAESHGSLAVMAILEGKQEDAKRLTQIAMRLDKHSFSAALAQSLLLQAQGEPELAARIIDRALNTPIDADGSTIAHAIAKRTLFAQ